MKKIVCLLCIGLVSFLLVGCEEKNPNIEGSLSDIMGKLYEGISEEEMPMMADNYIELTDENFKYYAFADVKYKEAIASESMSSTAHSVVLIRLENKEDAENAVKEIEKNADPRKWICVEAENKYVLSKGDLVVLIMTNDLAPKIKENFENLK